MRGGTAVLLHDGVALLAQEAKRYGYIRLVLRYGARGDLANADGVTAVDMMLRRRDAEVGQMAARLVKKRQPVSG